MKDNYAPFTDRMIHEYEGGYGWNRKDPGGPTKYGVTCWDLAAHRGQKMDSMARWAPIVKAMTLAEAEEIYATKYARAVRFDEVQAGVDCVLMDYQVNSGARPVRVLRAILNKPGPANVFDNDLLAAVNSANAKWLIDAVCDERMHFLRQIKTWSEFGGGWTHRVADLRAYSEALAAGVREPNSTAGKVPSHGKGRHDDQRKPGRVGGASGAGGATAGTALGLPAWAVVALVVLAVAIGVGIVLYQNKKAAALNKTVVLPPPQGGTNVATPA